MPATGFLLPTAQTTDTLASTTWTNAGNITSNDGLEVTEAITAKNTPASGNLTGGGALHGQNFGFDSAVPAGAQITKVEIQVDWRVNSTAGIATLELQATVGGVAVGSVRSNATEPTTLTTETFDITADRAWTRADLLNGTFELLTRGRNGNNATDPSYRWDYIAVQVTYAVGGAPPFPHPAARLQPLLAS